MIMRHMPRQRQRLVDTECVRLASHFLVDVPDATAEDRTELAEAIQRAAEDHIRYIQGKPV
jgi:hypothetical protein